ncbi:MAG: helix-turn-helix transcriptional regulator [Planctomycetota bacterium]
MALTASNALSIDVPLGACPGLVSLGVGVHGAVPVERFRLAEAWCLHLYRYDAELRIGGVARTIRPGSVSLIPAGVELEYRFRGRSEHTYAHLSIPDGGGATESKRRVPMVQRVEPGRFAQLEAAMREAVGWYAAEPRRAEVRVWDVLWRVADRPVDIEETTGTPGEGSVGRGERCVQELLSAIELRLSETVRVGELVDELELELSYNQILRLFRQQTGRSIAGYIQHRRVTRALYLLRHTSIPIKVIAIQVGVPDLQAFNKLMRKATGWSPRALRGEG